ncbi:hypothetical protein GCM10011379_05440 [Filimonas zeae]|uniref:Uncharacterized protein n=1 Tax=Filimonas zeae TaxID=1737353 RepID=A0A917MRK6_9BACT|nr:hypothetical protein GCM10011379_05440 [Filimonas zeae]
MQLLFNRVGMGEGGRLNTCIVLLYKAYIGCRRLQQWATFIYIIQAYEEIGLLHNGYDGICGGVRAGGQW